MLKSDAIALTLKEETKVRHKDWAESLYIYYNSTCHKVLCSENRAYLFLNANLDQDGWEIYHPPVIANGVIELFQKHKEICKKTGKDTLRWKANFGTIKTLPCTSGISAIARFDSSNTPVVFRSDRVSETFTLIQD